MLEQQEEPQGMGEVHINPFNEVETERILQFDKLIRLIAKSEDDLDNGKPTVWVWNQNDGKTTPQYLFTIDRSFIEGMKKAVQGLREEYETRPHMREAFNDVEYNFLEERNLAEKEEEKRLGGMWDNTG